jgi:hypothetical protein
LGGQLKDNVAGYQPVGFYKDGFGIVHLQGSASDASIGYPIFVLPPGYRPAAERDFAVDYDENADGAGAHGTLEIRADGWVRIAAPPGSPDRVSLDGVDFRP